MSVASFFGTSRQGPVVMRSTARVLASVLLVVIVSLQGFALAAEDEWQDVKRIVAIGDVHGDYEGYMQVLQDAGIVNRRGKWVAGETHFVQVGDVPDRGPDTHKIVRHLMKLEVQAQKAGGYVHALIGNHEAMNIIGDLRYVHPGEYAAVKGRNSKKLRENYYQRVVDYLSGREEPPLIDEAFRDKWMQDHPLGFVEHRQIWNPQGEFGAWVVGHNAVIKINRVLFVHGGLGPAMLSMTLRQINEQIRTELANPTPAEDLLAESEEGPLWYRGFARSETAPEEAHLSAVLEHFDADTIVVGHTPGLGTIVPRFSSRVLAIDSGISAHYGGHRASLIIEDGKMFTHQGGESVEIPDASDGLLAYYRRIAEIKPDVKRLNALIYRLENPLPEPVDPNSPAMQHPDARAQGAAASAANPH